MLAALVDRGSAIAELGVFAGGFLADIHRIVQPRRLVAVDLFDGVAGSGDQDGNGFHEIDLAAAYDTLRAAYRNDTRVSLVRGRSADVLATFDDSAFDAVYIDADHSYEGCRDDLAVAFHKVRDGGLIMGHDYEMNLRKARTAWVFGVRRAVDEFCAAHGLHIIAKANDGCVSYAIRVTKPRVPGAPPAVPPTAAAAAPPIATGDLVSVPTSARAPRPYLVYTTVGGDSSTYAGMASLLFRSILRQPGVRDRVDLAVVCDEDTFHLLDADVTADDGVQRIPMGPLNARIVAAGPTGRAMAVSMKKLELFRLHPRAAAYERILFLDADTLVDANVTDVMALPLDAGVLGVYEERHSKFAFPWWSDAGAFASVYFSLPAVPYTDAQIAGIRAAGKHVFNGGVLLFDAAMAGHFDAVLRLIDGYDGEFYYEQSFLNHYFLLRNATAAVIGPAHYTMVLSDADIRMFGTVVHFAGGSSLLRSSSKLDLMQQYFAAAGSADRASATLRR